MLSKQNRQRHQTSKIIDATGYAFEGRGIHEGGSSGVEC